MHNVYVLSLEQDYDHGVRGRRIGYYASLDDAQMGTNTDLLFSSGSPEFSESDEFMKTARYVIRRYDLERHPGVLTAQWVREADATSPYSPWGQVASPTEPPKVDLTPGFSKV